MTLSIERILISLEIQKVTILTTFRGFSGHFRDNHFYILDFHLALTFLDGDLCRKGLNVNHKVDMINESDQSY